MVDIFGPGGVVATELDNEFKAPSKKYQIKQKFNYFGDEEAEILKINREMNYYRGPNFTNISDGDIDIDGARADVNHTVDAPKKI
ncbi:hypothetical protein AYI69_g4371 [Smittium culicis]|uniref:Uncharacterized protein n=1 Tax=Smittium culicis TaxID=133412 RepID=A0A1R1YEA1_9FUNG|nr:hypothetical protein AYI69_g4371 [Smittium culicis]